jgi:hypothetical protein
MLLVAAEEVKRPVRVGDAKPDMASAGPKSSGNFRRSPPHRLLNFFRS